MGEIRPVCKNLYARLYNLQSELQFLENKDQVLSTHLQTKYTNTMDKFLRFLGKNTGKSLIYLVIKQKVVARELKSLHGDVSELFFELLDAAPVDQWGEDCRSPRAQFEAILTLTFELERHEERHSEEDKARMKLLMSNIQTASRGAVGQLPVWFLPDYEVEFEPQPFARGPCGSVHRGVLNSDTPVVVDAPDMRIDSRTARLLEKEMETLFQMDNPNVVKMLGACHVSSTPFLVCEDAINDDMGSYVSVSDDNKQQRWKLLHQAALGLAYIHSKGIVHSHLRLSNILVGADGQAKLSDFGLKTMRYISKTSTASSAHLRWRAPECLTRSPTPASDVYSFAMCMIEATVGEPLFAYLDDNDVRENLKAGVIPEQPDRTCDELWELVVGMTNADPTQRIKLNQVIDKLEAFATEDSEELRQDVATQCIVCSTLAFDVSRCCPQCGNRGLPKDESNASCGSLTDPGSPSEATEVNPDASSGDLLTLLRSGIIGVEEDAVLLLLQACISDNKRRQMQGHAGISDLVGLAKNGQTHFLKVCAFGCLGWLSELDSALSDAEFEDLRGFVRAATASECTCLVQTLWDGDDQEKLKMVVYSSCISEANRRTQLSNAGVVAPLVELLRHGSETLTIWTMDVLGNLANDGDAKRAIVAEGAIPLLVGVLQEGTETQRGFAAYVLGQLSTDSVSNSSAIVDGGAVPFLVGLLRAQANIPKSYAAFALGCIAANSDEYSAVIAQAGGIRRLVPLVRTGTDAQKAHAATVLGWLANLDENRLEMARKGAVAYLVALVGGGTQEQKENAAFALSFLAMDVVSGVNDGVITPLVALLRAGTEGQKEDAVCTLGNLAGSQENCLRIAREGGIRPLVGLLRAGNTVQKGLAALTLGCIGTSNEVNRLAIVSDEVLELLVGLIRVELWSRRTTRCSRFAISPSTVAQMLER